jgi:hypothetical protein
LACRRDYEIDASYRDGADGLQTWTLNVSLEVGEVGAEAYEVDIETPMRKSLG